MARSIKEVHTINFYPINEGAARRAKEKLKALLACELDAWVENDPYLSPREKQVLRNQQPSQEDKTIIR